MDPGLLACGCSFVRTPARWRGQAPSRTLAKVSLIRRSNHVWTALIPGRALRPRSLQLQTAEPLRGCSWPSRSRTRRPFISTARRGTRLGCRGSQPVRKGGRAEAATRPAAVCGPRAAHPELDIDQIEVCEFEGHRFGSVAMAREALGRPLSHRARGAALGEPQEVGGGWCYGHSAGGARREAQ